MSVNFEKIPLYGAAALSFGLLPFLYFYFEQDLALPLTNYTKPATSIKIERPYTDFDLPLSTTVSLLSPKNLSSQFTFSLDPARPNSANDQAKVLIRLPQTKQTKRVLIPASVGLEFNSAQQIEFRDHEERFWLHCDLLEDGEIEASLFCKIPNGTVICREKWIAQLQKTPILTAEEIPKSSPFKLLAEARYWGQDLFAEKFGQCVSAQRIELGADEALTVFDLTDDQWLVFEDGQWKLFSPPGAPRETLPLARITHHSMQGLEMEGWEGTSHIRLKIPLVPSIPLKTKGEELFSGLRIRSAKQISCVMDKQRLILRTGDWVLKTAKRWQILRKKEDKEAFLAGDLTGEIFVLDRIDVKSGVKSISGELFSVKRSQMASIECAQALKNNPRPSNPKGYGKPR